MRQLMHSFHGYTVPKEILDGVRRGEIASFCLFANNNVIDPAQVRELTQSLYRAAESGGHPAPLIGIDQEGSQSLVRQIPGIINGSSGLADTTTLICNHQTNHCLSAVSSCRMRSPDKPLSFAL